MMNQMKAQYADQAFSPLERLAITWLDGFYSLEHLLVTRYWSIRLAGVASAELKFAALVHDAERHFSGGPSSMPSDGFDNPDYLFAHSTRSADIVEEWLKRDGSEKPEGFDRRVRALIQRHEIGGNDEEDILQAADSLSFLQVFDWLVVHWVRAGHYTIPEVQEKLDWMVSRIRIPAAIRAALPIYAKTTRKLLAAHEGTTDVLHRRAYASSALRLTGIASPKTQVQRAAERQCQAGTLPGPNTILPDDIRTKCANVADKLTEDRGFSIKLFEAVVRKMGRNRRELWLGDKGVRRKT